MQYMTLAEITMLDQHQEIGRFNPGWAKWNEKSLEKVLPLGVFLILKILSGHLRDVSRQIMWAYTDKSYGIILSFKNIVWPINFSILRLFQLQCTYTMYLHV